MNATTLSQTIYDHPLYYDILFGWDRSQEADFYESVFQRLEIDKREPLLEVACGSGQVARLLAQRGWKLTGLDSREPMLAFLRKQAAAQGFEVRTHCADMVDFCSDTKFGAAFNPLSSFRLLSSDESAEAHLAAMAEAVRVGGVYVLDLAFDTDIAPESQTTTEIWEESRDGVTVRAQDDGVYVDDDGTQHVLAWGVGAHLRAVTSQWLEARVASVGCFTVESWHPESGHTPEGVSQWSVDLQGEPPRVGRAMVVLRRV